MQALLIEHETAPSCQDYWSYTNYLVPYIAVFTWGVCEILAIAYGGVKATNYSDPNIPELASNALNGTIAMGILGACTIPAAVLWTAGRAFTRLGDTNTMTEIFRKSVAGPLCAPDAIIINTLAAPFATPLALVWILSGCQRPNV